MSHALAGGTERRKGRGLLASAGRNIGYAWVPLQLPELGTQLGVESEWGRRDATVVPMPFLGPEKQIAVY